MNSIVLLHALKPFAEKKAKPAEKAYKMADGVGLYLVVNITGTGVLQCSLPLILRYLHQIRL